MRVVHANIRRWPLRGFPHGLLYVVEGDGILVLAVFHPRQDPVKWQLRGSGT